MPANFTKRLIEAIDEFFGPLTSAVNDGDSLVILLEEIGWNVDNILEVQDREKLETEIHNALSKLSDLKHFLVDPSYKLSELKKVFNATKEIFDSFDEFPGLLQIPDVDGMLFQELPQDLINWMTLIFIHRKSSVLYHVLELLTVIRHYEPEVLQSSEGTILREKNIIQKLELNRIYELITDAKKIFEEEYWEAGFDDVEATNKSAKRIFYPLGKIFSALGFSAMIGYDEEIFTPPPEIEERMQGVLTIKREIFDSDSEDWVEVGASLSLIPIPEGGRGMAFLPFGALTLEKSFDEWYFTSNFTGNINPVLVTEHGFSVSSDLEDDQLSMNFSIERIKDHDGIILQLGNENGTGLVIGDLNFSGSFQLSSEELDYNIYINVLGLKFSLKPDEGDSFIKKILPEQGIEVLLNARLGYSNRNGFHLGLSGGLESKLNANISFGPVVLKELSYGIRFKEGGLSLFLTSGIFGKLGPLKFNLKEIGLQADVSFPEKAGNLGLADLDLGFASPKGLGFHIDAKIIKGGGFLSFDQDKGEYLGFAELEILNKVNVKAIGIINTRLPDGQEGYSFLLMILTEFNPIQLGLGFTLEGIGGLIGLHRGLNLENIILGVKEEKFDYILFPEDPLSNLPNIISGLNEIMPIQQDHYAFGIMVKIGWGSPTIVNIKLGLIFEIPEWKLALIGVATAEIMAKKKTLVRLQLNFAITYDPDISLFTVDASLINSRFLSWDLEGDFAVRIRGGNDPYFLISAGGFHRDYIQPEGLRLPPMKRLKITMADGNPDIYAAMFFALTSNTIQFGAAAHASYNIIGIGFEADLGFEALIQFSPLYFKVEVWGGVYLKFLGGSFGLDLRGTVEGPYPVRISLYVTFKIWIFSFTVRVPTITIGKSRDSRLTGIAIWPKLEEQLQDERNWQPYLPPRSRQLVSVQSIAQTKYHPVGGIQIDQSRVPLNIKLQKFGNYDPTDYKHFSLSLKAQDQQYEPVQQFFAPSQFFDLTEEERFSRKSYEKYDSGIRISGWQHVEAGAVVEKDFTYEENVLGPEYFEHFLEGNSIAQSGPGKEHDRRDGDGKEAIRRKKEKYALVNIDTLEKLALAGSKSEAQLLLDQKLTRQPELEDQLEVMPMYELD